MLLAKHNLKQLSYLNNRMKRFIKIAQELLIFSAEKRCCFERKISHKLKNINFKLFLNRNETAK